MSLDDAIHAARSKAGRRQVAQVAHDQAERRARSDADDLAAEAVTRLADIGDEIFVRVEKARLFQPSQYLDYLGTRLRTSSKLRCWVLVAAETPVLLLSDGTIGRFRPPAVPVQRTGRGRAAEFVSTDELTAVGESTDPFIEPYGSYLEAVRHRLAEAIVRYELQATRDTSATRGSG